MLGGVWTSLYSGSRSALDEARCLARMVRSYRQIPAALAEAGGSWNGSPSAFPTPVVLVHGAAHNGSAWTALADCLRAAGFERLVTLDYRTDRDTVDALAADLGQRLQRVREQADADRVHVIGHSLGGLLLRIWHDGLGGADHTHAAVTLRTVAPPAPASRGLQGGCDVCGPAPGCCVTSMPSGSITRTGPR